MKAYFSILLAILLLPGVTAQTTFAQTKTSSSEKQAADKKRVVDWGINKVVAVKFQSGEKVEGRIAAIRDDAITIQSVTNGQIASREISFSEIKKISPKANAGKVAGKTALGILAGFGALIVIVAVAVAVGGND